MRTRPAPQNGGTGAAGRDATAQRGGGGGAPAASRSPLGYGAPHFPLRDHYAREGDEWMYGRGSHDKLTDSGDWREHIVLTQHRYMLEDVRIGLSFLVSCGELAGVARPRAPAVLVVVGGAGGGE